MIDLEQAAWAGEQVNFMLGSWDDNTLTDGCYTTSSDMHQIGVLLQKCSLECEPSMTVSPACTAFIASLLGKQCTAQQALQDAWLRVGPM